MRDPPKMGADMSDQAHLVLGYKWSSKRGQEVVNNVLQEEYPHLNEDEKYNQLFKQI